MPVHGIALSSGNLYGTVLEQGSLFGLQFWNPVDPAVAYKGPPKKFGTPQRSVGRQRPSAGSTCSGAGWPCTRTALLGGLGVSGDTACADHSVAWRARDALGSTPFRAGLAPPATTT